RRSSTAGRPAARRRATGPTSRASSSARRARRRHRARVPWADPANLPRWGRWRGAVVLADQPGTRVDPRRRGGAHVVNISGGQFAPSGGAHPLLADAVRSCTSRGILVVAAAGNDGCDCLHLPAALPNVLTVGALDRAGRPLAFSNWGAAYRSHGI